MANEIFMKVSIVDDSGEVEEVVTEEACSEESIGSVERPNHPEEAYVIALDHTIAVPRDDRTGQVTGSPRLGYLGVLKLIDRSSPLLSGILVSPTKLEVEVSVYRPDVPEEPAYTIVLKNARLVSMKPYTPDAMDKANDTQMPSEYIQFAYDEIEWEHNLCSTNSSYSSLG